MQYNALEQFQNQTKLKESQRFMGFKSHSQIRAFLEGKVVAQSGVLDNFVWLIGGGYKRLLISGEVPETLVNRMERPITSLEKFFSEYLQYFFRSNYPRAKIEELYIKFTNQMDAEDVKIVYAATLGQINIDPDHLERYAGNRRFPNGVAIFQRAEYEALKAEEAAAAKENEESVVQSTVPQTPAPAPTSAPTGESQDDESTGYDPLLLEEEENEGSTVDIVDPAPADNSGKAPSKPKAKVDEPKKERKVRVPRAQKEKK